MDPLDMPPPPPPDIARRNGAVVSADITDKITEAASALSPGQVVKDGFFTLFESVGALEIMDPKMDSACSDPHEEAAELYDVRRELLPDEVLGIMDQLLCHEMAWHLGYPLSQTLFTSVYIEEILMPEPECLEDADFIKVRSPGYQRPPLLAILRAYCIGLLKTCGYVVERIKTESYYEEEDFVSHTYHRTLLDEIDTDSIVACLLDAVLLLKDLEGSLPDDMIGALEARLQLRLRFLGAAIASQDTTNAKGIKTAWSDANSALQTLIERLDVQATVVKESFDARIQQKLASTMPPRPIVDLSRDDALGHLWRLFRDNLAAADVVEYSNPESLLTFVSIFQTKNPQPLVYTRCLLQALIFNDMVLLGSKSMRQVLDDDFSLFSMSYSTLLDRSNDEIEAPHEPRFLISQHMEKFRQRAAPVYLEILRVLCLNRCRVRRTLVHLIREWDGLHADAEQMDQLLRGLTLEEPLVIATSGNPPAPMESLQLSSWACLHKLRLMSWFVQLGFELDVYQRDELAGMYWYLNYLGKQRFQLLERTKGFVEAHARKPTQGSKGADVVRSLSLLSFSLLDSAVVWNLSDALTSLYTALHRLELITSPPRPYSTDALRYELRTRPFAAVGVPELVPFDDFKSAVEQQDVPTEGILAGAAKAAASARKTLEGMAKLDRERTFSGAGYEAWVERTKRALKACIAVGVTVATVQKMIAGKEEGAKVKGKVEVPAAEEGYHEWWIVPRVIPG